MAKRKRSNFERLQRGERLSRRERKQIERQLQAEEPGWEIEHRNVAGIEWGTKAILWPWIQGRQISRCGNLVLGRTGCARWWTG